MPVNGQLEANPGNVVVVRESLLLLNAEVIVKHVNGTWR